MHRIIIVLALTVGINSFAADAKKCEQAVDQVFKVMFKSNANDAKLQSKKQQEVAGCTKSYSDARAACLIKVAARSDIDGCSKL